MEGVLSKRSILDRALKEFATKVDELTQTAVDGRRYVLVEKLQAWMREPNSAPLDNQFLTNTDLLTRAVYYERTHFLPIDPSLIYNADRKCCVVVFSILLDLELGHLIDTFAKKAILDSRLPEDLYSLKRKLKDQAGGDQIAEQFNERQWKFCPAIFGLAMEEEYFENRIIPICRQSPINIGGTARVDQIVMQAEFVDRRLRNKLQDDQFASYCDKDYGDCFIFALKIFEAGFFQYFADEKAAFDGLRENRGVIHRLGCYTHQILVDRQSNGGQANGEKQEVERKTTMNLLLEYGTYDLRLIFGHHLPPVFPKEILAFWEALFEVADAVSGIHDFKTGGSEYNGWHADIKPENIIYVRGKYKLADPGFARFKKKSQGQKGHAKSNAPQIRVHGGTNTYGAPEVSNKTDVHQTIDIWSLGCVFSMAATWIVLGYQGVRQYQLVREKALGILLKAIKDDDDGHPLLTSHGLKAHSKPEQLDCFHNGSEVLKEVTSWHALLKASIRKTDPITEAVLDLIDQSMLLRNPEKRIKSAPLCEELRRFVFSAKKVLRDAIAQESPESRDHREHMEGLLKEIDKAAANQVVDDESREPTQPITPGLPVDRHALKVQLQNVPLQKTSHRFETLPDPRPSSDIPIIMTGPPATARNDISGTYEGLHHTQPQPRLGFAEDKRKSGWQSSYSQPTRNNTGFTSMTTKSNYPLSQQRYQNVIQARERLNRESKRTVSSIGMKRSPQKDEFLGKHFENRDIKYLVDDAESMADHWDEATFLLETLVLHAHDQDPDGPDLSFMNDSREVLKGKEASIFRKAMNKVQPKKNGGVHTNIKKSLERIFFKYLETVQQEHHKTSVRSLTVIIFTDGLWEGMGDKNAVISLIENFYWQLKQEMKGMLRERQVSIQFIQFGNDEDARERLKRLDDDLPYRGVEDMIDHEMFSVNGNVFKMLLGSFVEEIDESDKKDEAIASPDLVQNKFLPVLEEEPQDMHWSPIRSSSSGQDMLRSPSRMPSSSQDTFRSHGRTSSTGQDVLGSPSRVPSAGQTTAGAQAISRSSRSSKRISGLFMSGR